MRIKIFESENVADLEEEINNFLIGTGRKTSASVKETMEIKSVLLRETELIEDGKTTITREYKNIVTFNY